MVPQSRIVRVGHAGSDTIVIQMQEDLLGRRYGPPDPALRALADSISRRDPVRDATAALARGDYRVVGYCGAGCMAPGAPPDLLNAPERFRAVVTTPFDAVYGPDAWRLGVVVRKYSARYNRIVLQVHRKRDKPER
jgi:hypothetical protein